MTHAFSQKGFLLQVFLKLLFGSITSKILHFFNVKVSTKVNKKLYKNQIQKFHGSRRFMGLKGSLQRFYEWNVILHSLLFIA